MVALIISNSRGSIYQVWVGESTIVVADKALEWLREEHCDDRDRSHEAREDLLRDGYFEYRSERGRTTFQIAEAAAVA